MYASRYASYIKTGGNRIALGENSTSRNSVWGLSRAFFFFLKKIGFPYHHLGQPGLTQHSARMSP